MRACVLVPPTTYIRATYHSPWSLLHVSSSATIVANALENVCETTKMYSIEHTFFISTVSIYPYYSVVKTNTLIAVTVRACVRA